MMRAEPNITTVCRTPWRRKRSAGSASSHCTRMIRALGLVRKSRFL
jgi:hypothetical protein